LGSGKADDKRAGFHGDNLWLINGFCFAIGVCFSTDISAAGICFNASVCFSDGISDASVGCAAADQSQDDRHNKKDSEYARHFRVLLSNLWVSI
jgi:hypothetical protein